MAAELSYLDKLWNRGVDVGVGVETSVIVGLIGLLLYRGKLWLDEQRQRQEIRIAAEAAAAARRFALRLPSKPLGWMGKRGWATGTRLYTP